MSLFEDATIAEAEGAQKIWARAAGPLTLAAIVFASCLVGIYSRPIGFLAMVWPANALMLGLLVRMPSAATVPGWCAAAAAYVAADLLAGSDLFKALLLNGANLVGVAAGYVILRQIASTRAGLRETRDLARVILAAIVASAGAGAVGAIANPLLFGGTALGGLTFWFATELANYAAFLPVVLAAPRLSQMPRDWHEFRSSLASRNVMPEAALGLSCLIAIAVGGQGALALPVPALLWCAVSYPVFKTALLTLLYGCWALIVAASIFLPAAGALDENALISIRLGAAFLAIAPVVLSSIMQSRESTLAQLHHLAAYDQLTGAESRHAFFERARRLLESRPRSVAVLMIDVDHFKRVNDTHGHSAGDEVLIAIAKRMRSRLRPFDLFGRMGGEEFAAIIPDCPRQDAIRVAQRIRRAIVEEPVGFSDGKTIPITASIGMIFKDRPGTDVIDRLLAEADAALYQAKLHGRDRVVVSSN
ncbi:MAG: diguanylate cyclase [Rhodobiaceae bacterium]|nr:diguanylate cyclase [Rhodobiaceae bacterium]MCC0057117.1 diguanylate cyclase [Rhodobiaceae bacterium]